MLGILCLVFIFLNLRSISGFAFLNYDFDFKNWDVIKRTVSQSKSVYHTPLLTPEMIMQNKPVYDSGQSEYFVHGAKAGKFLGFKFSEDSEGLLRMREFLMDLKMQIHTKKFDALLITKQNLMYLPSDFAQFYQMVGVIPLKTRHINQEWEVLVWRPK